MGNKLFCEKFKLTEGIKGKTVIIQGLGNVGYWAARFFEEGGAKVIGIIEYNSSIYNPEGFHVDEAFNYFRANKSFKDFPKAKEVKMDKEIEQVMYHECDILIPAAMEGTINKYALLVKVLDSTSIRFMQSL
ncbi:MAG: hypothetical protein WCF90_11000 [Methanomicrobiales archaeon]